MWRASRTSLGIVTCPFELSVAEGILTSGLIPYFMVRQRRGSVKLVNKQQTGTEPY